MGARGRGSAGFQHPIDRRPADLGGMCGGVTPLRGDELRALRRLQRENETSPFVFVSERGSPFTTAGFARMRVFGSGGRPLIPINLAGTIAAKRQVADAAARAEAKGVVERWNGLAPPLGSQAAAMPSRRCRQTRRPGWTCTLKPVT
jgi:hypothetical protein